MRARRSATRFASPSVRKRMLTPSVPTSTRSTSSWTMRACSAGNSSFQRGSSRSSASRASASLMSPRDLLPRILRRPRVSRQDTSASCSETRRNSRDWRPERWAQAGSAFAGKRTCVTNHRTKDQTWRPASGLGPLRHLRAARTSHDDDQGGRDYGSDQTQYPRNRCRSGGDGCSTARVCSAGCGMSGYHLVLRKRQRPHPLPGGRFRLSAARHPRRRTELADQQLADRGDQRDGGVQERLPLHHDGSA